MSEDRANYLTGTDWQEACLWHGERFQVIAYESGPLAGKVSIIQRDNSHGLRRVTAHLILDRDEWAAIGQALSFHWSHQHLETGEQRGQSCTSVHVHAG